jgi:glucosamine-6-phosphate deaminase
MNAMSGIGGDANRIRLDDRDFLRRHVRIYADRRSMSVAAADRAAAVIRQHLDASGRARLVLATAASQLDFLAALAAAPSIDWRAVELFQLDDYLDLPREHPASFRRLLRTHFIEPAGVGLCHLIQDAGDPDETCATLGRLLEGHPLDLACLGIGENGHLAFNDPPADFETARAYHVVRLDEACRQQQVGEGWFRQFADVPTRAISMSIPGILRAREILAIVPDARKAAAVKATLEGPISPLVPASILRTHETVTLFLDEAAATQLAPEIRAEIGDRLT